MAKQPVVPGRGLAALRHRPSSRHRNTSRDLAASALVSGAVKPSTLPASRWASRMTTAPARRKPIEATERPHPSLGRAPAATTAGRRGAISVGRAAVSVTSATTGVITASMTVCSTWRSAAMRRMRLLGMGWPGSVRSKRDCLGDELRLVSCRPGCVAASDIRRSRCADFHPRPASAHPRPRAAGAVGCERIRRARTRGAKTAGRQRRPPRCP